MASKMGFSFVVICVFVIALLHVNDAAFEYFKLVQQWPKSFCNTQNPNCPPPVPNNFTLHGLWPDNYTTTLSYCSTTPIYNYFNDTNFIQRLALRWPNLKLPVQSPRYQGFWSHEWKRHGTCSLNKYKQQQYFDLALKLKDQYYVLDMLQTSGITPGHPTTLNQVNNSIMQSTSKIPIIKCNKIKPPQLLEIVICLDTSGTSVIDCPRFTSCPPTGNFNFP